MRISVTIPDEVAAQAQAHGIPIEAYVQGLLEAAGRISLSSHPLRTPEQIEVFSEAMAEGSRNLPPLPTENFTRESFYRDRP